MFLGDPDYFDRDLQRYHAVTKASISDTLIRYLDPQRRVTLSIVPRGKAHLAAADSSPVAVQ